MDLKGMILAAGLGTRLGALTETLPKPLLPVANRPVMDQGITCLRRLGISEICSNVSYRAQQILDVYDGNAALGVNFHWEKEDEPSGTAGGFKKMEPFLHDARIVLIAGDGMLDFDLQPLIDAHIRSNAFVSLGTLKVDDPSQYGVVVSDADGRIERFQEKPKPGKEISHQANTGIYIFEPGIFDLIPERTFYDFAKQVFPDILRRKLPFYAFPVTGYWTDIGNPGDYLQANLDFLANRIRIEGSGVHRDGNFFGEDAVTDGAELRNCVIGPRAHVAPGSFLTDCVVWADTVLPEPRTLTSTIITPQGCYRVEGKEAVALETVTAN